MKKFIKTNLPLIEFALRIYIAYYLWSYGSAKLDGSMFNNTTTAILKTELQKVDMFHLTWYYYSQSRILAKSVGVLQVISAGLLLFNRTVLLGCLIAFPIFLSILFVDLDSTLHIVGHINVVLPTRVTLYLISIIFFCVYRKSTVLPIFFSMFTAKQKIIINNKLKILIIPIFIILWAAVDLLICLLCNYSAHFIWWLGNK